VHRAVQKKLLLQQSSLSEQDQQTVGASSDVTDALRRTHELIAVELAKSEFAHQTLTESTAALAQLNESYGSLDNLLEKSRDLLGTLVKSQKSDTWYLQTAMYMLLVTGAWLIYRRILYYPVWWLVFLPVRLLLAGSLSAGRAVGLLGPNATPKANVLVNSVRPSARLHSDGGEAVPTLQVGQSSKAPDGVGEPDSMIEKVGRIIEENLGGEGGALDEEDVDKAEGEPNPKKRMWEEPPVRQQEDTRHRDEL
jgi:protein transport protein SEC20